MTPAENAPHLLGRASGECLCFCALSQTGNALARLLSVVSVSTSPTPTVRIRAASVVRRNAAASAQSRAPMSKSETGMLLRGAAQRNAAHDPQNPSEGAQETSRLPRDICMFPSDTKHRGAPVRRLKALVVRTGDPLPPPSLAAPGPRAASADLTKHAACVQSGEPRWMHLRISGPAASTPPRHMRQCTSSGAPPLSCETRASACECTSLPVSRCARTAVSI